MNNEKNNKKRDKTSNDVKSLLTQPSMLFNQKAEENIVHVIQQLQPLRDENIELKNTILATQTYLEQQRENLSQIIRVTESRELVKRIADFPTLISILQEDMKSMQETLRKCISNSNQQSRNTNIGTINQPERNSHYEQIKIEVSKQSIELQNTVTRQEEMISQKDQTIFQLNQLIEDENKKVKKNQNTHFELVDSYNEKLEELTNQINEEIDKQAQMKIKHIQMMQKQQEEHHTQVAIKQDQYEFALGELRNTYEKRMDKLIKDSEFRISEANKASIRANKELELLRNKYEQEIQKNEQQIILIKNQQIQLQQQQQQTHQLRVEMQQQSLYLHQTQAMIANLKKNNNIVLNEEQQLSEQKIQQSLENFYLNNPTNHFSTQTQLQQDFEHQQLQTQTSLWPDDISQLSPNTFKFNLKYADQQTTQISPMSNIKQNPDKVPILELDEILESKKQASLIKKLKKKRNQRSKHREDQLYYYQKKINDVYTPKEVNTGPSVKQSEETPNSKFASVNFTQAYATHHANLRRRSKIQISFSNNQVQQQEFNQDIQTQDISCQTDEFLLEYLIINENQRTLNSHQQESQYFSPNNKNQIAATILDNSSRNQHQFSLQILQSDQDEFQIQQKEEITILKEQIASLQQQNHIQAKNITDLQEKASEMQERMKENVKQMKQQIQKSSQENETLLKQLEKPKDAVKKKIELQKHLENQISHSENLQFQLIKATEIIKYFNNELENYKQMYNIFGQGTKSERLQQKKLPSIRQPSPKRKGGECTPRRQQSMYEEAQRLIDNLYDKKQYKRN
ncbi:unnamed protein product (macronuclear) [Paramecium tetraurelia]|uniref:Uncharacterized protein n=1 Tax=Paramecium tetraurelia TaxID=5888 RepID=A0BY86_PARTE|nr:uncharacterized protein GSPATT00033356001 [Paramecium tetraurelia]CAK63503.1 unnamed protein product [Paramecium tetraurelia]|eukprot:XP_001430901.1 hypothetical protein (macronuclear) [Paramecium tetraurelia strain d4-2]